MAKIRNASRIAPLMLQFYNRVAFLSSVRQRKRTQPTAAFCVRAGQPRKGAVLSFCYVFLVNLKLKKASNDKDKINKVKL